MPAGRPGYVACGRLKGPEAAWFWFVGFAGFLSGGVVWSAWPLRGVGFLSAGRTGFPFSWLFRRPAPPAPRGFGIGRGRRLAGRCGGRGLPHHLDVGIPNLALGFLDHLTAIRP